MQSSTLTRSTNTKSKDPGAVSLSPKSIDTLRKTGEVVIYVNVGTQLAPPIKDAYFDSYNKGKQWNWWTKDNKQCLDQIIICPFLRGETLWVREIFSTSAISVYPMPKAWYKDDFFGRVTEPIEPLHIRNCGGNRADCFACVEEREGRFKWSGPSKMPKSLSRYNVAVDQIEAVIGETSKWKVSLRLVR